MIWGVALVNAFGVTQSSAAQAGMTRVDDASPVPSGYARLRVIPSWTRFEDVFSRSGDDRTIPLASALAAESLGVRQIPVLAPAQDALRTLTGDPTLRLSLGRSTATAAARIATTAIAAEYGVSRWLTVSAVLPIVQTRTEVFAALNAQGSGNANVGPNPAAVIPAQQAQAVALQGQLNTVRGTLQARLAQCETNPASDPSCAAILANRGDVVSLLGESDAFRTALGTIFGVTQADDPQPFAPLGGTSAAAAITQRLAALTARFRSYVGSSADVITAAVPYAVGPAGFGDLQQVLLRGAFELAPDSLTRVYRINVGDVELGAKLLVFESGRWPPSGDAPSPWLRTRIAVSALVRLATGLPTLERLPYRYLEYGTGDGQTDVEGAVFATVGLGRYFSVLGAARYTAQLGEVDGARVPFEDGVITPFLPLHRGTRKLGDVFVAEITPRWLPGRYVGFDGHYALIRRDDDEYSAVDGEPAFARNGYTEQRVGVGVTYSTLRGARGRFPRVPVEVSLAHIETITGSSALVPRASRDLIEVRLYYRLLGR